MKVCETESCWAKIGAIPYLSFVGKDILLYGNGCHLVFINLLTNEEVLYTANNTKMGDGINCYVGHRTQNIFAFSERRSNPQIFLKTFPNFEEIFTFNNEDERGIVRMAFSESSLLITLSDLPKFKITVWNWRRGEKIAAEKGGLLSEDQFLRCNLGSPVFMSQLQCDSKLLNVWDFYVSGKKCILTKHVVKFDFECTNFTCTMWTSEGGLFVLDTLGCIYMVLPDYNLEKVIDFDEPGHLPTSFVWYKQGIAVAGPNDEIRHYKKSGTWSIDWILKPPEPTYRLLSRFDHLITVTVYSNILEVFQFQNTFKFVKEKESCFDDFCIIHPSGQHILALSHQQIVNCFKIETGHLMSSFDLEEEAILISENPKFPYAAIGLSNGMVKLISAFKPEKLKLFCSFFLMKEPINGVRFNESGTTLVVANTTTGRFFILEGLPGGQIQILATIDAKRQIADFMMVVSEDCYRIFMIPVTSKEYIAGNVIVRYCVIKNKKIDVKEYDFENKNSLFSRIVPSLDSTRDRFFFVVPQNGKSISKVEIKRGEIVANVKDTIITGHQMRDFQFRLDRRFALTWGYDGFIIARSSDFARNIAIALPHHRIAAGVKKAYIDPLEKFVISLGRDNVLVCTELLATELNPMVVAEVRELTNDPDLELLFSRKTKGFMPKGIYQGKCFLEVEEMKMIESERAKCQIERDSILKEFKSIQQELQHLLTQNLEGPDNEKLDLKEFNLDVKLYEKKCIENRKLRKATEVYLKKLIEEQNKISEFMIINFWDKMRIPGIAIKGIFCDFQVTNYVLRPPDSNREEMLQQIRHQRKLERYLNEMEAFHPWEPVPEEDLMQLVNSRPSLPVKDEHLTVLEDLEKAAPEIEEVEEDIETKIAFSGSDVARFIEVELDHYHQSELQTYFQTDLQWIMSKSDAYKLKEFFNEKFEKVMMQKQKEMSSLKQKNDRLRHIVSELNYFSQEKFCVNIEDPEWQQVETPELIIQVKDNEVPITPYVSPSEQARLDAEAAEAERIRLLLLADDFRERALMAMMNGVLEVRWEDELKKEVPMPKCMIEKEPENFNEDDIRAVKDYDEKVAFLLSERERYKTLLRAEFGKVANSVRDNIKKFNGKLGELMQLKLKVDSAISQESLKINRMKLFQFTRKQVIQKEQTIMDKISNNEKIIISLHQLMQTLHESVNELRSSVETFQAKDKILDRAYKKDFQDTSIVIQEQALKLYKKRPKFNFRAINSATLLNELGKSIVGCTKPSLILNTDCIEFLKQLDHLDLYVGVPPVVDEHTYALICKHRRNRIEYEIKLKALQNELAEAETTAAAFQKRLQQKRELNHKLNHELHEVRQEFSKIMFDGDVQIVLPKGLVEMFLTGSLVDFEDAVLICRKDVENINKIIKDFGAKKIKALEVSMNFRRKIMALEWEHKRMRMLINDLQEKLVDIDGVRLTKEIQFYLKCKDKEKTIPFETEVDMIKASYENTIQDRKDKVRRMKNQIRQIKEHDKDVGRKIMELNVDVCELGMVKDPEFNRKEREYIDTRMKTLLKRSKLVEQIQNNHHEILMLQTELELLRLKTFPTLKYKVV